MAPISLQNSSQNWETHCGPLSERMSTGRPWSLNSAQLATALSPKRTAVNGDKMAALEKQSTIERTPVKPWRKSNNKI